VPGEGAGRPVVLPAGQVRRRVLADQRRPRPGQELARGRSCAGRLACLKRQELRARAAKPAVLVLVCSCTRVCDELFGEVPARACRRVCSEVWAKGRALAKLRESARTSESPHLLAAFIPSNNITCCLHCTRHARVSSNAHHPCGSS